MFFANKDQIFDAGHWQTRFTFDAKVAAVFDDMALRSIPMYRETMQSLALWAKAHVQADTQIIDLGCSTGTSLIACMSAIAADSRVIFRGIDSSPDMISQAKLKMDSLYPDHGTRLEIGDVRQAELGRASVIILNYTLQFIPPADRPVLMQRIFAGLVPGGIVFISDKLAIKDDQTRDLLTAEYHRFKEAQGYSRLAIERKRQALENVLVPMTFDEEIHLLSQAGFAMIEVPLKWNQFCSFVARRDN